VTSTDASVLLLFDIDGTLVRVGGAGRRAMVRAFAARCGIEDAMAGVRLDGSTDPVIVADALRVHLGREPHGPSETEAILETYLECLAEELSAGHHVYEVLPGARALLEAARSVGRSVIGLATGNVERGARLKLEAGDLMRYFAFGGYGSDAADRAALVARGIERGQEHAVRAHGRAFAPEHVLVLGDTEKDVFAARRAGAVAVGVLAGSARPEALLASNPDVVVESLQDPALWALLGLQPSP
jgi:phosphoglycolate phosphatase